MKANIELRKSILFLTLTPIVVCTFIYFSLSFYFSSLILVPSSKNEDLEKIRHEISAFEIPPNFIKLDINKETQIEAWHFKRSPQTNCMIVFTHGWKSSRLGIEKFYSAFTDTYCDFISYDIRAHATHPARYSTGGIKEKHELVTLSKHLMRRFKLKDNQIAWFGLSLGASTSLQAAALDFKPAFVVADSPFQDWNTAIFERGVEMYGAWINYMRFGIDIMLKLRAGISYREASAIDAAPYIHIPVLLIHSASDTDTAPYQSENIFKQLQADKSEFHLTQWGAKHGKDIEIEPDLYRQIVDDFIQKFAKHFSDK